MISAFDFVLFDFTSDGCEARFWAKSKACETLCLYQDTVRSISRRLSVLRKSNYAAKTFNFAITFLEGLTVIKTRPTEK
jgi:hypothetical protein